MIILIAGLPILLISARGSRRYYRSDMQGPLEITFRGVAVPHAEIEEHIRNKISKFDDLCRDITGCRIVVEQPHRTRRSGNNYVVRIFLSARGIDVAAGVDRNDEPEHLDVYAAINDSVEAVRRQLVELLRRRHGEVKHHEQRL